jgi:8-oxo-dGTP pyrophosphatase MutT (NUDIX family)
MQESQFSLKSLDLKQSPCFASKYQNIDLNLKPFDRAVAIISIKNQQKILAYHRSDNLFRLPGGHVEEAENPTQTARRETLEEVGVSGLDFKKYLASCHLFYSRNGLPTYCREHYFWFECEYQEWLQKQKDEDGMKSILIDQKELLGVLEFVQYPWLVNLMNGLE